MHYTWREIFEQPKAIEKVADFDTERLNRASEIIKESRECYLIGAGSSLNAGMYGGYLFSENNRKENRIIPASEFAFRATMISGGDAVIVLSQSGESSDILEAIQFAKSKIAEVICITNNEKSEAAIQSDVTLNLPAGLERGIIATKTVTTEIAMLIMLSSAMNNDVDGGKKTLIKIAQELKNILGKKSLEAIKKIAKSYENDHDFYVIGNNFFYPVALEAALKLKEGGRAHAEGFDGSEFRHGPITLIEKNSPIIYFSAQNDARKEATDDLVEIKKSGGLITGVSYKKNKLFDNFYQIASMGPYSAVLAVVFAQLFAYFIAEGKGLNPDEPKNLEKIVT
jgi:glucosamine--fructose-6-phosphate aminotransferase (isomerizing)